MLAIPVVIADPSFGLKPPPTKGQSAVRFGGSSDLADDLVFVHAVWTRDIKAA
jgi:hypothetical protein